MLGVFSILAIALVCGASAQSHCCAPHLWEGNYYTVSGFMAPHHSPDVGLGASMVHLDYHGQRQAASGHRYYENSGHGYHYRIVDHFTTKKRMYVDQSGYCEISPLDHTMKSPCIPPQHEHHGSYYIGTGMTNLTVDSWGVPMEYPNEYHFRTIRQGCLPFQSRQVYIDPDTGFGAASFASFANITPSIKNTTVFDTPPECQAVDSIDIPKDAEFVLSLFHED